MKHEQQQQAQHLYFQTDLSKSEIASMVGISRRTLHYWVHDYNWDHIRKSAQHIPLQLAENCYYIMAKMQEDMLSAQRSEKAPTYKEVNALYKLTLTINKLKTRNTLNETLELGGHFMEYVNSQNPEDADFIRSYIDGYILSRAADQPWQFTPPKSKEQPTAAATEEDDRETQLDLEDIRHWAENSVHTADKEKNSPHQFRSPGATPTSHKKIANQDDALLELPRQSIPLPKNEKHLNRAQRRQLARSKAAA